MERTDRILSYFIGFIIALTIVAIGYQLLPNYTQASDIFRYRIASNFAQGNGLQYNAAESVIPTFSPLFPILIGLFARLADYYVHFTPDLYHYLAATLNAVVYGITATVLYRLLHKSRFNRPEILAIFFLWLLSLPFWVNIHSPSALTLLFILIALENLHSGKVALSGFIAGLSIFAQPEAIIAILILGIYALNYPKGINYWKAAWVPTVIGALIASILYTDGLTNLLTPSENTAKFSLIALIWIGFLLAITLLLYRYAKTSVPAWLWLILIWSSAEVLTQTLTTNTLSQTQSLPLSLSISIGLVILSRLLERKDFRGITLGLSGILFAGLLLTNFPKTESALNTEIQLGQHLQIPAKSDLLIDRGDGLLATMPNFDGNYYRLDAHHSPHLNKFVERQDFQSLIIATAPQYIYFNTQDGPLANLNLQSSILIPMGYTKELDLVLDTGQKLGDELWIRRIDAPDFLSTQPVNLNFGPDIQLISYATDHQRFQAGDIVRFRLDWELNGKPKSEITILMSLLDITGLPIVSIFPIFPAENWDEDSLSTYHALRIPPDSTAGLVDLQVTLDYKAANIGRNMVDQFIIALPKPENPPTHPIGQINSVLLYDAEITLIDLNLQLNLDWGITERLGHNYQVLVHLIPADETTPVAFGDGPPLAGSYPTSYWEVGEVIPDTHTLALNELTVGEYRLLLGFYILETFERLRDSEKDSLHIANVSILPNGEILITPLREGN